MTPRERDLVALVLEDAPVTPALRRWLATPAGRREARAYRRTLDRLDRAYDAASAPAEPVAWYASLRAPIGRVLVAATTAGVVRVAFRQREADFVRELARRWGLRAVRDAARTAAIVGQLRAYFGGRRRRFDLRLDLSRLTPFHRRVLAAAARVPAGRVVSYAEIARRVGRPHGSRAVGQALGRNPIPIVVPCHRVVASDGGLGGYSGGLGIKRALLRLEGARADAA